MDRRLGEPIHTLYLNGLERTSPGLPERLLSRYLALRSVDIDYLAVDWHSGQSFEELLSITTTEAEQTLRAHGRVVLIGASAGGSLAINTFHQLRTKHQQADVSVISLSGWLRVTDPDHLEQVALNRPGKQPSQAFFESAMYCNDTASPHLTALDKQRMRIVKPVADKVVPLAAMDIEGVAAYTVPIAGHVPGIMLGALRVPDIVKDIYANLEMN